jgi:hypothetical protein
MRIKNPTKGLRLESSKSPTILFAAIVGIGVAVGVNVGVGDATGGLAVGVEVWVAAIVGVFVTFGVEVAVGAMEFALRR